MNTARFGQRKAAYVAARPDLDAERKPAMREIREIPEMLPLPRLPTAINVKSLISWQEWQGSNLRPPVLETGALPIELHS